MIDFSVINTFFGIATGVNVVIASVVGILVRPLHKRINNIQKCVTDHEGRLIATETKLEEIKEDTTYIRERLDRIVNNG